MAFLGQTYKTLRNGLIDLPEDRREIVAAYETGDIFYASGKKFHQHVRDAQKLVRNEYKQAPNLQEISSADVIAHYEGAVESGHGKTESYERIADRILRDAANAKASDIKVVRTPARTIVRFMIAGQEIDYNVSVTSQEGNEVISYIFDARDEGAGHSTKQQGEFQGFSVSDARNRQSGLTLPPNVLKLRCQKGFHETNDDIMDHLVMRIFYREQDELVSIESLGHDPDTLGALKRSRDGMKGAVIIGGETGDGKSTTIISAIQRQYDEQEGRISILTVEDPVEYKLDQPGIIQIPIQSSSDAEKRTLNYRAALMHFVRSNPHVGVVSELRDAEAGRQVLQFIKTGHQVWTTIHINAANGIAFRLIDMGIQPTEMSQEETFALLMKQTLVPLLCRCAKKGEDGLMHRNEEGCDICRSAVRGTEAVKAWAGFQRMVALAEFIEPDDTYLECIRQNDSISARRHWLTSVEDGGMGGITLSRKLNMLVHSGAIDPKSARKKGATIETETPEIPDRFAAWIKGLMEARK